MITKLLARTARGIRLAAGAMRRHAVAAGLGSAILAASAGGGIGYAVSQPASATLTATAPSPKASPAPNAGEHRGHHRAPALRVLVAMVAKATHQTRAQVLAELRSGKSLDDIAGSSAARIQQTILAKVEARLDAAVKASRIAGRPGAFVCRKQNSALRPALWHVRAPEATRTRVHRR